MGGGPADELDEFDFDGSEAWRTYLAAVEFDGGTPTPVQIVRLKQKWYQRHVNPAYSPPASAPELEPEPEPEHALEPDVLRQRGRPSSRVAAQAAEPATAAPRGCDTAVAYARAHPQDVALLLAHTAIVANAVVFAMPVLGTRMAYAAYWRMLKVAFLGTAWDIGRRRGAPQLNGAYWATVAADDAWPRLLYAVAFLHHPSLVWMAALPLSAWSLLDGLPPAVRFADAILPVPVAAAAGDLERAVEVKRAQIELIAAYTRIALTGPLLLGVLR